jgi:predicted ATPase
VTDALRTAVGVSPRADGATLTAVVDALAQRRALLVLDNCEHVVEALAPVVHEIADSCPDLAVLATSRTPLRVAREQVWPLRPLPVPDATDDEALAASPAVRLFLRRAAQAAPDVDLRSDLPAVAAVCRSLDGLPLALELAAARMGSMRPADLIPRLRGRLRLLDHGSASGLARHRTLQAVIGWSYDLLDDRHREVFEALAVFAGDFTLEDAEGLLARVSALVDRFPELAEPDAVAGAVGDLVDQSLVVSVPATGAARYSLLETVRVYGRAALAGRAWAAEVHRRHAEHFAALATGVAEAVYAQPHVAALDRLLSRWADLREAAAWARRHDAAVAARLIGSLIVPVESLRAPEATEWADDLLRLTAGDDTVPGLAGVAAVAAAGARFRGEIGRVTELLGLGRDRSDVTAHQHSYLGMLELEILLLSGRFAEARRRLPAVHGQCRAAGAPAVGRMVTAIEILVEAYAGDPGQGHRQAVDLERTAAAAAEAVPAAWARYCQGECLLALDPDRAAPLLQDALARARSLGDAYLTGVTLVSLASIAGRIGDQAPAAALFAEVIRHWSEAGDRTHQRTTLVNVVELLVRAGRVESAAVLCGSLQPATDALWPSVTAALGPARAAALASSGQALGDRETVRLALSELDDLAG